MIFCIFLHEIYSIEDCIYYWDCTSNDGHWTIPSGYSFDANGITMNQASNDAVCDITFPKNCIMECTMKYYSVYKFLPQMSAFNVYSSQDNENTLVLRDASDPNAWNNRTVIQNTHLEDGLNSIQINNDVGSVIVNGAVLGTKNLITSTQQLLLRPNTNPNRKYSVKDLKIKPL